MKNIALLIVAALALFACTSDPWKEERTKVNDPSVQWNNIDDFIRNWPLPPSKVDHIVVAFERRVIQCNNNLCTETLVDSAATIKGNAPLNGLFPDANYLFELFGFSADVCTKISLHYVRAPTQNDLSFDVLCYPAEHQLPHVHRVEVGKKYQNSQGDYFFGAFDQQKWSTFDEKYNLFLPWDSTQSDFRVLDVQYAGKSSSQVEEKIGLLTPSDRARAQSIFSKAFDMYQAGDFGGAKIRFMQGLDVDPGSAAGNFYLAETLMAIKKQSIPVPFQSPLTSEFYGRDSRSIARYYYNQTIKFSPDSDEAAKAQARIQDVQQ